jgi:hypothetical protein
MNYDGIIELLECAKINIDNIAKGVPAELAKWQIDEAIKAIENLNIDLST